jgi:hypothetical protein
MKLSLQVGQAQRADPPSRRTKANEEIQRIENIYAGNSPSARMVASTRPPLPLRIHILWTRPWRKR